MLCFTDICITAVFPIHMQFVKRPGKPFSVGKNGQPKGYLRFFLPCFLSFVANCKQLQRLTRYV